MPGPVMQEASEFIRSITPEMYRTHIFRVAQLPAEANGRQARATLQRSQIQAKLGIALKTSRGQLRLDPAPGPADVRQAIDRMQDPLRRIVDEFFWFWPIELGSSGSDAALAALERGADGSAQEMWESAADPEGVALHNLAVLMHVVALDYEWAPRSQSMNAAERQRCNRAWKGAYRRFCALLEHPRFWKRFAQRLEALSDPRLDFSVSALFRRILGSALLSINVDLAKEACDRERLDDFDRQLCIIRDSGFNPQDVLGAIRSAMRPVIERFLRDCDEFVSRVQSPAPMTSTEIRGFRSKACNRYECVVKWLPPDDSLSKGLADKTVMACLAGLVRLANETSDWKVIIRELHSLQELSCGPVVQRRFEENLDQAEKLYKQSLCFYCEENEKYDPAACEYKLSGLVRDPPWLGGRIAPATRSVQVPRCVRCQQQHERFQTIAAAGCLTGVIAGVIVWASVRGFMGAVTFVISIIAGANIGTYIGRGTRPAEIKPVEAGREHPEICELLSQGWVFGEKPAGIR